MQRLSANESGHVRQWKQVRRILPRVVYSTCDIVATRPKMKDANIITTSLPWWARALLLALAIAAGIIVVLYLSRAIRDPDFFWHLKTGEWIWQNKSLPEKDPFAFSTPEVQSSREHFILTAYWLSQLIFYGVYEGGGWLGIIALRFIVVGWLIYLLVRRGMGDGIIRAGLLLIFLTLFLREYNIDRPQVYSFVFFAWLLFLLDRLKQDKAGGWRSASVIGIPLLMMVWSNMHGGHVIGQMTLIVAIAMEGLKFLHAGLRPLDRKAYRRFAVACTFGVAGSLVNPNTYRAILELLAMPPGLLAIQEYMSTIEVLHVYGMHSMALYWLILLLGVAALVATWKEVDITHAAILIGIGYYSFTTMRYVPFLMIAALPAVGVFLSNEKFLNWSRAAVSGMALAGAVFFSSGEASNIERLSSGRWLSGYTAPENAVQFIRGADLKGNMYNYYDYGGYLIWRLAPERKVFIDGRGLSPQVFEESQLVNSAGGPQIGGIPFWKFTFNAYGINYAVLPVRESNGQMFPLAQAMLGDRDWVPVFSDINTLIFVKATSENAAVISRYASPR